MPLKFSAHFNVTDFNFLSLTCSQLNFSQTRQDGWIFKYAMLSKDIKAHEATFNPVCKAYLHLESHIDLSYMHLALLPVSNSASLESLLSPPLGRIDVTTPE